MIHVEAHHIGHSIQRLQAPLVVIFDSYRNPLAVVVEHQPGVTMFYSRTDPEFREMLRIAGIEDDVKEELILSEPVPSNYKPFRNLLLS